MENIPLPANSVDVIKSTRVISLSGDEHQVLRKAFRVRKRVGRFEDFDVAVRGEVPEAIRKSIAPWAGCIARAPSNTD